MTAVRAFAPNADVGGLQTYIVKAYYNPFGGDFIEIHGFNYRFAAVVHKGSGLHQQTGNAVHRSNGSQGFEAYFFQLHSAFFRKPVKSHKACVVAGVFVFFARVSQSRYYIVGLTCGFGFFFVQLVKDVENAHLRRSFRGSFSFVCVLNFFAVDVVSGADFSFAMS